MFFNLVFTRSSFHHHRDNIIFSREYPYLRRQLMTWTRFIPFPLGTSFHPSTRSQVHRGTTSSPIVINDWFSHSNKSLSYSFTVLLAQHWAVYITEMRTRVLKLLARPPRGICTFNNEFYRFPKYHEPFPLIFYNRGRRWNLPIDLHISILNATLLYDLISLTNHPMFVCCNCTYSDYR